MSAPDNLHVCIIFSKKIDRTLLLRIIYTLMVQIKVLLLTYTILERRAFMNCPRPYLLQSSLFMPSKGKFAFEGQNYCKRQCDNKAS